MDYYKEMFDYTLNYYWNKNRDTVQLKYTYKTATSCCERFTDRLYSFVSEKLKKTQITSSKSDSLLRNLEFNFRYNFDHITLTYDAKGNVLKWLRRDMAIKNSYPVDMLFEYKYNDNNELIEASFSSTGFDGNFELGHKYEIHYLEYDKNGNWTLKNIFDKKNNSEYTYKREIEYF